MPVTVLTFETGMDEAERLARRIHDAVQSGKRRYRDFAVFMRINALSRGLEVAFIRQRVPYQIVKGLAFFDRKENRDILAYLRLLLNPRDDISFQRIVNEPARGIGKVTLEHLRQYADRNEMGLLAAAENVAKIEAIKNKAAMGLRVFAGLMHELRQLIEAPPDEVIRKVLERTGYRRMLLESDNPEDQDRLANIEELITAAKQFATDPPPAAAAAPSGSASIGDFLENITLASDLDGWNESQDCVSVMTMHAAKGLEFPVVYMLAVEMGLLPHERSLGHEDEIEEERRLAFVGMTRAKEELYLCNARMREFRGQTMYAVPSIFLNELPQDAIQTIDLSSVPGEGHGALNAWRSGGEAAEQGWADAGVRPQPRPIAPKHGATITTTQHTEGMVVRHEKYGQGRIVEVSGHGALRKVKIRFTTAGERSFIADKVQLEIVRK